MGKKSNILCMLFMLILTAAVIAVIFHFSDLSTVVCISNPIYKAGFIAGLGLAFILFIVFETIINIAKIIKKR